MSSKFHSLPTHSVKPILGIRPSEQIIHIAPSSETLSDGQTTHSSLSIFGCFPGSQFVHASFSTIWFGAHSIRKVRTSELEIDRSTKLILLFQLRCYTIECHSFVPPKSTLLNMTYLGNCHQLNHGQIYKNTYWHRIHSLCHY